MVTSTTTTSNLDVIERMEYPGRMIIIGRSNSGQEDIIVYAITGRSPSSQARKFKFDGDELIVAPTDMDELSRGDIDLLIYPAVKLVEGCAVLVSNGKHTRSLENSFQKNDLPVGNLERGLRGWTFEPDDPHYTPRISAIHSLGNETAVMSILLRSQCGGRVHNIFEFPLQKGKGRLIATYDGTNQAPLPSFKGTPRTVVLSGDTPRVVAENVWSALGDDDDDDADFRVAVGVIFIGEAGVTYSIINRHELS